MCSSVICVTELRTWSMYSNILVLPFFLPLLLISTGDRARDFIHNRQLLYSAPSQMFYCSWVKDPITQTNIYVTVINGQLCIYSKLLYWTNDCCPNSVLSFLVYTTGRLILQFKIWFFSIFSSKLHAKWTTPNCALQLLEQNPEGRV